MSKYIVCGQQYGSRTTIKIGTYDDALKAYKRLAQVRKSDKYKYEWIVEVPDDYNEE